MITWNLYFHPISLILRIGLFALIPLLLKVYFTHHRQIRRKDHWQRIMLMYFAMTMAAFLVWCMVFVYVRTEGDGLLWPMLSGAAILPALIQGLLGYYVLRKQYLEVRATKLAVFGPPIFFWLVIWL